jgi:hypothetical protein
MIAASALVVAVLASYAGIGMLSLSATAPFKALSTLPGVDAVVSGIGFQKPTVDSVTKFAKSNAAAAVNVFADVSGIDIGPVSASSTTRPTVSIQNQSSSPIEYQVHVSGAPGVSASFANGSSAQTVKPTGRATVFVTSSALYAGPISGQLEISAAGLQPKIIPIQGTQAPLAPGAVTATPAAGGAVNLSWAPSGSLSGVAGYIVKRSSDGTTFTQVGGLIQATTTVDQTPSDAQYTYEVVAVSQGSTPLQSAAGPTATVTSDSTAPAQPSGFGQLPAYINQANVDQPLAVTVQLPAGSQPSDSISVTATDASGAKFTQTASGGGATAQVTFDPSQFAQGPLVVAATATDAAGNPSSAVTDSIVVDTIAPLAPASVSTPAIIATGNDAALPVTVQVPSVVNPNNELDVSMQGVTGAAVVQKYTVGAADAPLTFDASGLPDGPVTVTAWVVDAAGNKSAATQANSQPTKDTSGPAAPSFVGIPASESNPANVVTPSIANAVTVQATFDVAPAADDSIVFWVNGTSYAGFQGDGQTTTFTVSPPIDLSGLSNGTYTLGIVQTDGNGNVTKTFTHFHVDTSGPQGPDSVGVPAGPNNPAGYVNAATQAAATIVATFAAPTDPADQIALSVGGLSLGTQSGGESSVTWTGDLSSLPDGTLQILGTITDPNGVQSTFTGSLIKDTTPPPAPAVAGVVGPPPNVITPGHDSCVNVGVAFNQAPDPSDTVTVTLSDGANSVQGSAPAGDGQVTVGCMDASSLAAGPVSVTVTVTDLAGNSVTFTGTPATKLACQNQG